jgi:hypothetical protein
MDLPEALSRLEKLEDALLAQIQEVRCIQSEIQKHGGNGSLEPLLGAEQVAQILVGHVHAQARSRKIPSTSTASRLEKKSRSKWRHLERCG